MIALRRFVTSGVGFCFVVVGVTGVIFKLFFKNHLLEEVHGWIGLAFVAAAVWHIVHNWPSLRKHLADWRVYLLLIPILLCIALTGLGGHDEGGGNPRAILSKLAQGNARDVARAFGKDSSTVVAAMKSDGLHVGDDDSTIDQLAQQNHRPPEGILSYFVR